VIAGLAPPQTRPLDPKIELRDYQQKTVDRLASPPRDVTRSLAVLPTGTGKTIVFAALLDRLLKKGDRALVIAHREELLVQAREKIAAVAPSLHVEIEQAALRASRKRKRGRSVVVGSVQTMRGKRLQSWAPDAFKVVVVDEAHHAIAESYLDLLTHFGCFDDVSPTRLVGVTATPGRTDGVGLGEAFQEIAICYTLPEMIKRGHLSEIRAWQVQTKTDLRNVKITAGDYNQAQLEKAVNNDKRNLEIIAAYEKYASGTQTIAFCAGVDHSHEIARLFNERGTSAKSVWGAMDKDERADVIASFHAGQTRILTNFGVLTEGFDAPGTGCIILARPTKSELLYTQMLGRGTRLHPGKDHLLVIDIEDVASGKSLASVASLFGLPETFQTGGGNVVQMAEELEEIEPRLRHLALDRESLDRLLAQTKAGQNAMEIDLFFSDVAHDGEEIRAFSPLAWVKLGDERYSIRPEPGYTYEISADTLGRYATRWIEGKRIRAAEDKADAFRFADWLIRRDHEEKVIFIDTKARWRRDPASEKQIALLARLRPGQPIPTTLTKGQAKAMIDALFASSPHPHRCPQKPGRGGNSGGLGLEPRVISGA
jgi:ATP-dependent helicase IRC3